MFGKQQLEHNLGLESFDWIDTDILDDSIVANTTTLLLR
jgi:hypothetical protein